MSSDSPAARTQTRWREALETLQAGFFWRTFLLFAGLLIASVIGIFASYRLLDSAPPEQRLAWEIASIVNLTRSGLIGSAPERRLQLLEQLADEEGLRIQPLEPSDKIEQHPLPERSRSLEERLRLLLDDATRVAGRVNDQPGLWISFNLAGDAYWLVLPIERLERQFGPRLSTILWVTGVVSLLAAFLLSWQADRPLAAIALALNRLGRGEPVPPLPESGPPKLAALRRNFNRMSADLSALEEDRSIALAGISHDLRSPLTRLRLELEMARLPDEQRQSMIEDIERIDAIVGQFVDYARLGTAVSSQAVDASSEVLALAERYRIHSERGDSPRLTAAIAPDLNWRGEAADLRRVVGNLVDNAFRHGRRAGHSPQIEIRLERDTQGLILSVEDDGPGIPAALHAQALRPFSRLDPARTDWGGAGAGSGLGLAIVARIARRYEGKLRLDNGPLGGLRIQISLPDAR